MDRTVSPTLRFSLLPGLLRLTCYGWVFLSLLKPLADPDLFWHLASGRFMVEKFAIPFTDVFSLTCRATSWVNTYWLFEIVLFGLYRIGGYTALILLHALVVVGVLLVLEAAMRARGADLVVRTAGLVLFFVAGTQRGHAWGQVASLTSLLLLSLFALHLQSLRARGWNRSYWIWPAVFLVWSNLHRGFLLGLAVGAIHALLAPSATWRERLRRGGWIAACALATLVNPYTAGVYRMMWDDMTLSGQYITGWDRPAWRLMEAFWVTIGVFWVAAAMTAIRRRRIDWDQWLTYLFLTALSIRHVFAVPFALALMIPALAAELPPMTERIRRAMAAAGIGIFLALATRTQVRGGILTGLFPVGALDMIESEGIAVRFYNDYLFGGYWLWRFGGNPPVFIDGRYPGVRGYQPLLQEINAAKFGRPRDWAEFLKRHEIDGALMKYLPGSPYPSLYEAFFPRGEWALVYWDDAGLLFLRRTPALAGLIRRTEFQYIQPDSTPDYFLHCLEKANPAQRQEIAGEIRRNMELHPESRAIRHLLRLGIDRGLFVAEPGERTTR